MSERLPEFIDPDALAEKRRHLKGQVPISKMARLADALLYTEGTAAVDLSFGKEGRTTVVSGHIEASLILQCQCCLQSLEWPVSVQVSLGVVRSIDEAKLLSEHFEPLLMEEENVALLDIVQDELVLAVPTIPQHEECKPAFGYGEEPPAEESVKRPNPFAALADLKKLNLQ